MPTALISLGSNLGDRQATLLAALERISECRDVQVVATSRWYSTNAVGGPAGQGEFLNGAALLDVSCSPGKLLTELQRIESELGRQRRERWNARTIDHDILLFGDQVIDSPSLVIPHPRMTFRRFVLEPAAEIAGTMRHPATGHTIDELLENIDRRPRYVALAGKSQEKKRKLAAILAAKCDGILISDPDSDEPLSLEQATEQLNRRAELLTESDLDLQKTSISDFWIGELLCDATEELNESDVHDLAEALRTRRIGIAQPTLLIVLDDSNPEHSDRLNDQITRVDLPAVLRLNTDDWPTVEQESTAAVLAM